MRPAEERTLSLLHALKPEIQFKEASLKSKGDNYSKIQAGRVYSNGEVK